MRQPSGQSFTRAHAYNLSELNAIIRETLDVTFPDTVWVVAEISETRCNSKGHCYLELVEKKDDIVIAQIKANIWAYTYRSVSHKFEHRTGETLRKGMKILLSAEVTFHELYGLSLNIKDIDPTYSLGEMARRKKETIDRLNREGLIGLNKALPLPSVAQRIALISSESAAGYGDFVNHIENNPHGYKIFHVLYRALMQGQGAEETIISALSSIKDRSYLYDVVVIIRGGGSQVDLSCFDSYTLAVAVARFPLPVITGIGHERDDTVCDIVAHTRMKTPTAAAGFIIDGIKTFEERLIAFERRLIYRTRDVLKEEEHRFRHIIQNFGKIITRRFHAEDKRLHANIHRLIYGANQVIAASANSLAMEIASLGSFARAALQSQDDRVRHLEQGIRLLDPVNVLKRGYSITYLNNKAVKAVSEVSEGDIIKTRLCEGSIKSKVGGLHEG